MVETPKQPLAIRVVRTAAMVLAITAGVLAVLIGLFVWSHSEWLIDRRRARIRAEVTQLSPAHPWAGTYYRGDGLGCNELLSLSPSAGFQYTDHGCLGLYHHAHGAVDGVGSRVTLHSSAFGLPAGTIGEYEVINWGPRRYLVEPGQLLEYVNAVNQYQESEYRVGLGQDRSFYLRTGDEQKKPEGKPSLPPEYARLLLARRIEGRVTAVAGQDASLDDDRGLGTVDIDIGLDQGAFEGMELYLLTEERGFGTAVLFEVAEHSSRAKVNYRDSFSPLPAVGWTAASRRGD
jgi:hypothetical protein